MHPSADDVRPRAVWKRSRTSGQVEDRPLYCGGEDLTHAQREQLWADEAAEKEAREREEREARTAAGRAAKNKKQYADTDEEDDDDVLAQAEKRAAERYAVKLLKQNEDVWGGADGTSGVLG